MKALAAEIVRKLTKRLQWLAIRVRELTGDMQMTKAEIAETQIIVTTPEKWDVVTRKPTGEGDIASVCLSPLRKYMILILKNIPTQLLKLLIIDEVHLLSEERGAVIEAIVARTLRQVCLMRLERASLISSLFLGGIKPICYPYRGPECHASELR
jgi:antiviral helicase SLH1